MVFRVLNNKLYRVLIEIENEDEFIKAQSTKYTKFIKIDKAQLPQIDLPCDEIYYKLDSDEKIIIDEERTIENCKNYLIENTNQIFNEMVRKLIGDYPEFEIQTWPKQEAEARAYLKDNTIPTPLIDKLTQERGIPKDVLVKKIVEKADAYATAVGALLGKKQKIEDIINSVNSIEEIKSIDILKLFENSNEL